MKEYYIGLIFKCPKGKESVRCPFKYLREISMVSAYRLWNEITFDERTKMIKYHKKCLNNNPKYLIES